MQFERQDLGKGRVELKLSLANQEWGGFVRQAEQELAKGFAVKGFRRGKAPREIALSHFGEERIFRRALELALPAVYSEVLEKENLSPLLPPELQLLDGSLATPPQILVKVVNLPVVELGDYGKISLKKGAIKISPAEVENALKQLQRHQATYQPVERAARRGDWAKISFAGKVGGIVSPSLTSRHHPLILGEGALWAGFEEAIFGLTSGAEKSFQLTFPADFRSAELAGKTAEFHLTLHQLKEVNLPALDDKLAQGLGFADLSALREKAKEAIQADQEQKARRQLESELFDALIQISPLILPEELVEAQAKEMIEEAKREAQSVGLTFERYLQRVGKKEEELKEGFRPAAERRLKIGLILEAVREKEKITVSKEQIEGELATLKKALPEQAEELEAYYRQAEKREQLARMLAGRQTVNFLLERVRYN